MKRVKITEARLKKAGFKHEDLGDDPPYDWYVKHRIQVWDFNGKYWLVDMLDQAGIEAEFQYMDELEAFFKACKLDMYSA